MYKNEQKTQETPYLSGGYLNWLVSHKKCENHISDVNKIFLTRI